MDLASELLLAQPDNPLRPPAWRWEAARELANRADAHAIYVDDVALRVALDLQKLMEKSKTERNVRAAIEPMRSAANAYAFWANSQAAVPLPPPVVPGQPASPAPPGPVPTASLYAAELEALVLAGKPTAKIARITNVPEPAVRWYEQLFFDVRDRLRRPAWVTAHAIGPLHQGTVNMALPALIRAYGYYTRSARIVRAVTSTFDATAARAAARDPLRFFTNDAAAAGGLRSALSIRLTPIGPKTYARIVELHHEGLEIELKAQSGSGGETEDQYRRTIEVFAKQVEWSYREAPVGLPESLPGPRLVAAAETPA